MNNCVKHNSIHYFEEEIKHQNETRIHIYVRKKGCQPALGLHTCPRSGTLPDCLYWDHRVPSPVAGRTTEPGKPFPRTHTCTIHTFNSIYH
jgi:hypothetical protein